MARYDARTTPEGEVMIPPEVRELIGLRRRGTIQFVVSGTEVEVVAKRKSLRPLKKLAHMGPATNVDRTK